MAKVFKITPKEEKQLNGVGISPSMEVYIIAHSDAPDPFHDGGVEVRKQENMVVLKKGEILIPFIYDRRLPGWCADPELIPVKYEGEWFYINQRGEERSTLN